MRSGGKVVTLFLEGPTEEEFYHKLLDYIKEQRGGRLHCELEYRDLSGIGNFKNKAAAILEENIVSKRPKCYHVVALCYDTDVFERTGEKPLDWNCVEKRLYRAGADKIIHVKAKQSIEDWFFCDKDGLRKRLKLSKKAKIEGNGVEGMEKLFKKAGDTYRKGHKCKDLVKELSIDIILPHIRDEISGLLKVIR